MHHSAADTHVRALLAAAPFHADHTDRNLPDHTGRVVLDRAALAGESKQPGLERRHPIPLSA